MPSSTAVHDLGATGAAVRHTSQIDGSRRETKNCIPATRLQVIKHSYTRSGVIVPIGAAKSAAHEAIVARITGASLVATQMHDAMKTDELFGQIDMPDYDKEGRWVRNTTGYLPDAHLAMVQEIDKGEHMLRSLLRVANERRWRNGDVELALPLITMVASANEVLPEHLAPVWDRFLIRETVTYIAEFDNFKAMVTGAGVPEQPTTITLAELQGASNFVCSSPSSTSSWTCCSRSTSSSTAVASSSPTAAGRTAWACSGPARPGQVSSPHVSGISAWHPGRYSSVLSLLTDRKGECAGSALFHSFYPRICLMTWSNNTSICPALRFPPSSEGVRTALSLPGQADGGALAITTADEVHDDHDESGLHGSCDRRAAAAPSAAPRRR
ncbi:AAA family ATPase [Kineococcus sp. NPDC059986]|uniref:AAA family ATPase n=1 Tax=Kineococcus sp. NPDC059986 TaxID=3155538 RepID=UPI00344D1B0E